MLTCLILGHARRYLIVIDDIWDLEPWKTIQCALDIQDNLGSRLITTTRIIGVAEQVGGCYRLKPLSNESSEILFYGRIFGSVDKCPPNFCEISKKILKKCGGVPLAIITTSSLLANKSEHIKVWYDLCDSIGSGLGRNPGMDDMTKILMLSYYDLPSHLKTCLLYLSIFPEDYKIDKDRLIWMWVAEGFVQHGQGHQSFHETGESYFNELLNRSLIQPTYYMDVKGTHHQACRVHDTVLDLIISLSIEESFITTTTLLLDDEMKSMHIRRLSLYNSTTWPTMKMPKLRSLTIFKHDVVVIDTTPSLSWYHLLRVLDLRDCRLEGLASLGFVGILSHLRYLALSSARHEDDQLPIEIGKLQFLQTLDLSLTAVKELPSSVTGLKQLMCLRGGTNCYGECTRMPDGLKKLTSLEVLEVATVGSKCIAEELGHLIQLRVLVVKVRLYKSDGYESLDFDYESEDWKACSNALLKSLGRLKKIESLHIDCAANLIDPEGSLQSLGNLTWLRMKISITVPKWIGPAWLPTLSYLHMVVHFEQREDIRVLGTLPCLRHLQFRVRNGGDQQKERSVLGPDAFPCLVFCEFLVSGRGVVPSMFPQGAMSRLQEFVSEIDLKDFCSGGQFTIDDDLALDHLPSLRSVFVRLAAASEEYDTSPAVGRAREKLKHEAAVHPNHPHTQVERNPDIDDC
jgi:disease resistance protein RPM1